MSRCSFAVLAGLLLFSVSVGSAHILPDLPETEITLEWKDFKALVEASHGPPTAPPKPPARAFVRSAEYRGSLQRGVLLVQAALELEVLADDWIALPLWEQGAVVSFVGAGALLHRQNGRATVLARGPGSFSLRAELAFEAPQSPGENRLQLSFPEAPTNLLRVQAGEGVRELEAEAGLVYRSGPEGLWLALANGAASLRYRLPFERSDEVEGEELTLEPRVLLQAYQLLSLGEGVVSGALVHDYQVRVAPVDHFDLELPDGVEVFEVSAPALESWKILERDERRVLHVKLAAPAEGAVRVVVSFEAGYDAALGELRVPRFSAAGIEREAGFVAVAADGAEVELELSGNLLPADVVELPEQVRGWGGNLVSAYKYSGAPDAARVKVTEHEDAAVLMAIVERLNATTVLLESGVEATWMDLVVKNNRKQFLRLRLPSGGVEIWSLLIDGEPTRPKHDGSEVLLPLPTAAAELSSRISLVLLRRGADFGALSALRPYLPRLDLPVSEAMWSVYLPPDRLYWVAEGGFRVEEETHPLRFSRAGRRGPSVLGAARSVASYDRAMPTAEPSEGLLAEQKKQEAGIEQYYKSRQSASRKGALPVRVGLPGGIAAMAKVTVARILMVDEEAPVLQIRSWPLWFRSTMRWLKALLLVGGGLLLASWVLGTVPRRLDLALAAAAALALAVVGLGLTLVVFVSGAILAGAWIWQRQRRWRAARRAAAASR